MRFLLIPFMFIFLTLISSGIASKFIANGGEGEDWNTSELRRNQRTNVISEGLKAVGEVFGKPEIDGNPELDGKEEDCIESKICKVATCDCVDHWELFSQTCNLVSRKFCSKRLEFLWLRKLSFVRNVFLLFVHVHLTKIFPGTNIDQIKETTDADGKTTYHYYFEAVTNFNHNAEVTVHVLSTNQPLFDTTFDYGSYAVTGKMRTYHMNGTIMCLDAFLHEGIDKDDCWYDVRAMGNQPLCPKKRKFFNVANHADVMVSNQASYMIDRR